MNDTIHGQSVSLRKGEGGGGGGGTRGLRGEVARKDVVDSLMVVCEWHRTYVDHIMPLSKAFKLDISPDSFIY